MTVDFYTLLSVVSFLTLLTTLKLTLTGQVTIGPEKRHYIVFHPIWLGMLGVMIPLVIGYYVKGKLSPWPVTAFAMAESAAGFWAGVLAAISTVTVDFWMFWSTAAALLTFTVPLAVGYEPIPKSMHKYFYLVNVLSGLLVLGYSFGRSPN